MRKNLLLLCLLIFSSSAIAQIKITDTFDGMGSLDWSQYADKDVSALTSMGFLELKVNKEGFYVNSSTDLPILP